MVNLRGIHQKKNSKKETCKLVNSHFMNIKNAPQLLLGRAHSLKQASTKSFSPKTIWKMMKIPIKIEEIAK